MSDKNINAMVKDIIGDINNRYSNGNCTNCLRSEQIGYNCAYCIREDDFTFVVIGG